jgi:hypothetical protein
MSWDQRFFDPIIVPGRKPLLTLRDAAEYITELPKAEHGTDEWQAAMEALCWSLNRTGMRCSLASA